MSERAQLRWRQPQNKRGSCWVVLLDCSASMLRDGALGAAQAAVLGLLALAYRQRRKVAVLRFSGQQCQLLQPMSRPPKEALDWMRQLQGGGATPMGEALSQVARLARQERGKAADVELHLWLFSDGKVSREPLPGAEMPVTVVDTERGRVSLGAARQLAGRLGAEYLPLDAFTC